MDADSSIRKTIGVLGGMGSAATAIFFQKIVKLTPARSDQEHIPAVIYNLPQVPDRTKAILGQGDSPVPLLRKGILFLQKAGADFICMPYNTAHHYVDEIVKYAEVPVVNLIETVVREAVHIPRLRRIGLLTTRGAIVFKLYHHAFAAHNIEVVTPEDGNSTICKA